MTATRVQPIDRLPDTEPGRCTDWIGRQSEYADFYDDRRSNLPPPCRFASTQSLSAGRCLSGEEKGPFDGTQVPDAGLFDVALPCMEPCVEEPSPYCSQYRDCAQASGPSASKSCQLGTVDVEDLALCFEPERSQGSNFPRAYNRATGGFPQFWRVRAKYHQYPDSSTAKQLPLLVPSNDAPCGNVALAGDGGWLGGQFCDNHPFAYCTEERWLQCPVSDSCTLYDTAHSYGRNVLPPCAHEDPRGEYWGYHEDEQLLEDYLSNEKRKEKSRDAARYRRSKETDIFTELAAALPVPPEQAAHLDKASVMRLAIAYLKVRSVVDSMPAPLAKSESSSEMDELSSKALNGFMLVLSSDGNMVYLSENVSDYLGVSQMDMMGQSVYEYSHPCDHDELTECLSSKPAEDNDKRVCSFFLRLKCTLTSKGRKVNLKSASYKVIHCTGRLTYIRDLVSNSSQSEEEDRESEDEVNERSSGASLVLVGCPIPHPSNIEIPLGRHTFLSKHSLGMKFTYADEKLAEYLGWNSEELMGQSVFEFHHALDNLALDKSFKSLFSKGQCETVAYRFLGKRGGYAWVVTQATLIHCSKQQKPLSVVCVNYVLRRSCQEF